MSQLHLNDQIRAALFQLREVNPRSYLYLLLDGNHPCAVDDPLHLSRLPMREIAAIPVTVPRADFAHDATLCPALVRLYSPGDRGYPDELLLEQSINHAWQRHASINGSYVSSWLLSEKPVEQVATHLAKACELFDVLGGRRRVLPLFEPHRLSLVADAGKDAFLRRWLGSISHWLWVDLNGQLRSLAAHELSADVPGTQALGQHEWQAQQRVADARVVALAMADAHHRLPSQPESAIDAALQRAMLRGLRRTEDLVFFALNDFSIAPGWATHPAAARAISQALEGEQTLSELISALSDDTLEEIAAQRQAE